jgi:hypothetical protein
MAMHGAFGAYPMTREASGTTWQPEATPMDGVHLMAGDWMAMWHGHANLVYDHQGGPRGGDKTFAASMLMGMGQRAFGGGTLGVRAMVSLDPAMGKSGYPLLFQTGETANGRTPLVDRQHPHDLLMELSASYSRDLGDGRSAFVYAGLPGEPALGPTAFMHRFSGMDNPEAPLTGAYMGQATLAWGRNRKEPGQATDGYLLESALRVGPDTTVFGRLERVQNDELLHGDGAAHDQAFSVGKLSIGAVHEFAQLGMVKFGAGALASRYWKPNALDQVYGSHPGSWMVFLRAKLATR